MQNVKTLENMTGHLTQAEREERERREERFKRDKVVLQIPEYLSDDPTGMDIWRKVCKEAEEFNIFDDLDGDTLGTYCSVVSRVITLRKKYWSAVKGHRKNAEILGISKELRFQESLQLTYASKLGLTPEARVRLAQKIVTPEEDPDADLYG